MSIFIYHEWKGVCLKMKKVYTTESPERLKNDLFSFLKD